MAGRPDSMTIVTTITAIARPIIHKLYIHYNSRTKCPKHTGTHGAYRIISKHQDRIFSERTIWRQPCQPWPHPDRWRPHHTPGRHCHHSHYAQSLWPSSRPQPVDVFEPRARARAHHLPKLLSFYARSRTATATMLTAATATAMPRPATAVTAAPLATVAARADGDGDGDGRSGAKSPWRHWRRRRHHRRRRR